MARTPSNDQMIGELRGKLDLLIQQVREERADNQSRHEKFEETLDDVQQQVAELNLKFSEVRGGWRVLGAVSGLAAAIGAACFKLASVFFTLR